MISLTAKESNPYHKQKFCWICKKRAVCNICNQIYKTPEEIPVVFNNGSTYDYHHVKLIIKY